MVKKHIHNFNRGMAIGFEILGLVAFTVFLVWLFLVVRLSEGPLDVSFLTRKIEKSLNAQEIGFEFAVDSTVLTWGGAGKPFVFEMKHVQINRPDKTPVLSIERVGVQLSKRYLAFGKFVPRAIRIYGPAMRIVRGEDGRFTLNVSDAEASAMPANDRIAGQTDFIKSLLAKLNDSGKSSLLGGLQQVSISDAALLYEDRVWQVNWKSMHSDVSFTRGKGGMVIDSIANVELDPLHTAYLRGSFYYSWTTHKPNGVVYFSNFNPALAVKGSEKFADLAGIDMPVKGSIAFEMDEDFHLGYGRFVMGTEPGFFNARGFYKEPLPVKKVYMQGKFNIQTHEAVLEEFQADLDGPVVTARASITHPAENAGIVLALKASLENTPMDKLKFYWPESLTPDPRAWVTEHLSTGIATKATLDLAMSSPVDSFDQLKLDNVSGEIDFNDIKVDYFPPLKPVTKATGKATYDRKSFNLDIAGGILGDMQVTGSKIRITDLDIQNETAHSKIDIDVSLTGPLQTALKVLDSKPLGYPKKLGIKTDDVGGNAAVDVNFKFPLHKALTVEDVEVSAKAKLDDVMLMDMVAGLPLSGGPMAVVIDKGAMTVKGKASLGAMPVDFTWLKNFSEKAQISSKVEAQLPLDEGMLRAFGVPDSLRVGGVISSDVVYTAMKGRSETLSLKGDITPTAFTLPIANYEKKIGTPGTLDLTLGFKDGKPHRITSLNLMTEGTELRGNAEFGQNGKSLRKAMFDKVRLGGTSISLALDIDNRGGYIAKIVGPQFDASKFLSDDEKPNSDAEAAKPQTPITISMSIGRLITGENKYIDRLKLYLRRNTWNRIEQMEASGMSGGKPLQLRYGPGQKGYSLRLEADNAGAALSALGITKDVRGGKIIVIGDPDPSSGRRGMKGSVSLTDFTLVNVPALGRLLNALSLTGIGELLNGRGVAFKKMRADYWWIDQGQPETGKNVRLIKIKDGQTSGASLGLTFEGRIDKWDNTLDIGGTIIPVSDLNKLVSAIPLVGDILTGGGGGVFAATYTIQGPKDQPTVMVNPLSVLAPGILRKLFFEKQ